jgi:hypothetical protein
MLARIARVYKAVEAAAFLLIHAFLVSIFFGLVAVALSLWLASFAGCGGDACTEGPAECRDSDETDVAEYDVVGIELEDGWRLRIGSRSGPNPMVSWQTPEFVLNGARVGRREIADAIGPDGAAVVRIYYVAHSYGDIRRVEVFSK